ncbi:uncharacterized protein PAC_06624 [Phialocephala subalpina]|uniref:Chromo domain-containing protein n=1 Tax=Phialocephala subalpina TaxID=576137 RepID=A0A1L7WVE4_9HELO|nr:uncharacterized protein PAC_06624 [Phialocephala subalpina]
MEPASRKRVRESTPRSSRPSKSSQESPTPPPRSTKQRRRRQESGQEEEEGDYFPLGTPAILDEERRAGGLYYLFNWADNPKTGEKYAPTWEKAEYATQGAREEWKQIKTQRAQAHNIPSSLPDTQDSQESQPIRTAKRKRGRLGAGSTLEDKSDAKKPRRAGTKETASLQSASEDNLDLERRSLEIPDTYEEDPISSRVGVGLDIRVEVPAPAEGFNRDAYAIAPLSSQSQGQNTQRSPQSAQASSQLQTPARKISPPFIWDEDIEDEISDSADQPGSSSYKPSDTPAPRTSVPIRLDTETTTGAASGSVDFGTTQSSLARDRSGTTGSYIAEPAASLLAAESYRGTQVTSTQSESSILDPRTTQQSNFSWRQSGESESQSLELPNRQLDEAIISSEDSGAFSFPSQNPHSRNSTDSQFQSSTRFLTQIPLNSSPPPEGTESGSNGPQGDIQDSPYSVVTSSIEAPINREDNRESDSVTLAQEFQPQPSLPAGGVPLSSFAAAWQASRVISPPPRQSPRSVVPPIATELRAAREATIQTISPHEAIESIEQSPFRSSTVTNSQKSRPKSQEKASQSQSSGAHRSQSSHLPSPPTEDILPSIEQPEVPSSSAPARHDTPPFSDAIDNSSPIQPLSVDSDMESNVPPASSGFSAKAAIKQRLAATAAEWEAKLQAEGDNSSESPMPPVINAPAFDLNRHVPIKATVEETLLADEPSLPSFQPFSEVEQSSASLDVLPPKSDQFFVPLPMVSYVRDMYNQEMRDHRKLTAYFASDKTEVFEEGEVDDIDSLLDKLRKICDHQDLYDDDSTTQLSASQQAGFAETCSTKCMFLAALLARLKSDLHILILVRPGRMTDIIAAILQHHGISYRLADQQPWSGGSVYGSPRVTLHPTGTQKFLVEPPSVVLAFDSTSRDFAFLNDLRCNPQRYTSGLAPLISLVVSHSIEHLERCFDDDIDPIQKKIRLVKCLRQLADTVGQLKPEYEDPAAAATAVANYLEEGAAAESWSLLPMPEFDEIDLSPEASQEEPKAEMDEDFAPSSHDLLSQILRTKRQLSNEDAMETDSPKRQRLTPVPGTPAGELDISHVSDSVVQASSNNLPLSSAVPTSSKAGGDGDNADRVSFLLQKIKDLEIQLRNKDSSEAQLRRLYNESEIRAKDLETSIANIQPKYQEALNDRGNFEHEFNQSLIRETETRKRLDAKDAKISELKEKNTAMALELSTAQKALSESTIPEVAELSKMKQEVTKVKAEKERLEKRLANMQNELEYMRSNYQTSSTAASEAVMEARDLKSANADLQAKADANTVRIHEIQRDEDIASYLASIKKLKGEKEDLERLCEKLNDELTTWKNKRPTRGTSQVPNSPRPNAGTMSPNPRQRVFRGNFGNTSRSNSPGPSEMMNFGEVLTGRGGLGFGNHLQ